MVSDRILEVPTPCIDNHGNEVYDDSLIAQLLLNCIDEADERCTRRDENNGCLWRHFEEALGVMDFSEYFADGCYELDDKNEWHTVHRNSDTADYIKGAVPFVTNFFSDWISSIDVSNVCINKRFAKLVNPECDRFLTFNYTKVLEQVYGINEVCHIHGCIGEELVVGHGNDEDRSEEYMAQHIGSENSLYELDNILRKDTKKSLRKNNWFFDSIQEVEQIYSFGFSYSDVDMLYIKTIIKKLRNIDNVVWFFNNYHTSEHDDFKRKIVGCGYTGKFDVFSV